MNALLLIAFLAAQDGDGIPTLTPGERVRVHVLEQRTLLGMPLPGIRGRSYRGTLTAYAPEDSIALQREKWLLFHPPRERMVAYWEAVRRIDVPDGHDLVGGIVRGAGFAFGTALGLAWMDLFVCRPWGGTCVPGFWKTVAWTAVVSVPVGAIIGSQSTHWKPVYRRRGR